jgi:hypothetical protein
MPPPWLLFAAAAAVWALAGAATKQLKRLANVTKRTAKDRISLDPAPFSASGRRASRVGGRLINLQQKAGHAAKTLQAQVPKSYSQTRSLRERCKNGTQDAIGE